MLSAPASSGAARLHRFLSAEGDSRVHRSPAYSLLMSPAAKPALLTVDGREIAISNPQKVLFPQAGYTKLDLAHYYVAVSAGALRGAGGRPNVLVRYPNGID